MAAHPFRYAQKQHANPSRDWTNWCLVFVRLCFDVAARAADAAGAWAAAERKHPVTSGAQVPRGVPVFWTGGSHGHGHVALSRGDGTVWTTDFIREGKVDVARIDDITHGWGLKLAGWTEDINGVTVWTPPKPPKPQPRVDAVKGIHASGKFDGDVEAWVAYLAHLAAQTDADLVTTTESQQRGIVKRARQEFGKEWHVAKAGEFMLITRRARITHKARSVVLSKVAGLIAWRQMHAAIFRLRLDGVPARVFVTHGPSAIQSGDKWSSSTRQVKAAQQGWARIGHKVHRGRHIQIVAGDSNLDMHRPRWLHWMTDTIHAPSVWTGHLPKGGTHAGGRLIDVAHVKGLPIVDAEIGPKPPKGFDHTPIVYQLGARK